LKNVMRPPVAPAQDRSAAVGTRSPPTIIVVTGQSSGTRTAPDARSWVQLRHSAAGASTAVTPCRAQNETSSAASNRAGSGCSTSAAPEVNAGNRSPTEASKVSGGSMRIRCPGPNPCTSRNDSVNCASAWCPTITPFGRPVDPEVKMM
jgi:hypothetical protein